SIRALFASVGHVDAVVCAAGAARFAPLAELTDDDFAFSIANKLMGQVNVIRQALAHVNDGGSITVTSGVLGQQPAPGSGAISLVNAALEGFARAAALEAPRGIRVNVVSPPWIAETLAKLGRPSDGALTAAACAKSYVQSVEGSETGGGYRREGHPAPPVPVRRGRPAAGPQRAGRGGLQCAPMDELSRLRAGRGVPRRGVCRMLPAAVLLLAATFAGLSAATSTADAGLRPVRAQARGVDIGPGTLLVAVPGLPDPNFSETVVFIVHHTEDGTMGLVLDRRTDVTVGRLFESIDELRELTLPVFAGGPVARSSAQALVRSPRAIPDGRHIVGEVH